MNLKEQLIEFLGMQIGRLWIGQKYFTSFYQMSMILLFLKVLLDIPNEWLLALFGAGLIFVWFMGYFADKSELSQKELKKTIMQQKEGSKQLNTEIFKEALIPMFKVMIRDVLKETLDDLDARSKDGE